MKKLVLILSIISLSVGCTKGNKAKDAAKTPEVKELLMQEVTVGTGEEAKDGNTVKVNYKGTFMDGKEFDSSYSRNQPFEFKLGTKQVIEGWDIGVRGMKVGGKRVLVVPPAMAYGEKGAGGVIPPNTPLKFEVELLAVAKGDAKPDAKKEAKAAKDSTKK
jgi:FKBP-type peptidyl-prolyl cis-trans isomerase FkpA